MCLSPEQQQQMLFVPKFNLQLERRKKSAVCPGGTLCGKPAALATTIKSL